MSGTSGGGVFSPDSRELAFISNFTALTRLSLADGQTKVLAHGRRLRERREPRVGRGGGPVHAQRHALERAGGGRRGAPAHDARRLARGGLPRRSDRAARRDARCCSPASRGRRAPTGSRRSPRGRAALGRRRARHDARLVAHGTPALRARRRGLGRAVRSRRGCRAGCGRARDPVRRRGQHSHGQPRAPAIGERDAAVPAEELRQQAHGLGRARRLGAAARPAAGQLRQPARLARRPPRRRREGRQHRRTGRPRARDALRGRAGRVGTLFTIWNGDGSRLVFRRFNVPFWAAADGSGQTGVVPGGDVNTSPGVRRPRPRFVHRRSPACPKRAATSTCSRSAAPSRRSRSSQTPAYEGSPHLSPDKRWLAYQSNASGQPEIYVRRYPELDRPGRSRRAAVSRCAGARRGGSSTTAAADS